MRRERHVGIHGRCHPAAVQPTRARVAAFSVVGEGWAVHAGRAHLVHFAQLAALRLEVRLQLLLVEGVLDELCDKVISEQEDKRARNGCNPCNSSV